MRASAEQQISDWQHIVEPSVEVHQVRRDNSTDVGELRATTLTGQAPNGATVLIEFLARRSNRPLRRPLSIIPAALGGPA